MLDTYRRALAGRNPKEDSDSSPSQLGHALTVSGKLETDGELRVHGNVEGRINAGRLFVGSGGYVRGDVAARDVQIGGHFIGRVFALNVTLENTAKIEGRIFHHTATVARGALIDGRMPWRPLNYFDELEQLPEKQP